MTWWFCPINV